MSKLNHTTSKEDKKQVALPTQIIGQLFAYYRKRENSLIQLLYKKGATQKEIADTLRVDQALISRNFRKEEK